MGSLYGLIGAKLQHSISPLIHTRVFESCQLDAHYHLFELQANMLETAITGLKALNAVGVNVTIPYKIDVMPYLDAISPEAASIGSVNTIHFDRGRSIGYNTDYDGFGQMLERFDVQISHKSAVILGSGGAAKSVLRYLLDKDVQQVFIVQRKPEPDKIIQADSRLSIIQYGQLANLTEADIIINCTPSGMYPHMNDMPIEKEFLRNYSTAIDLIYNPKETLFLRTAKEDGLKTVNGLYMLIAQAIAAQKKWNSIIIEDHLIEDIYAEISRLFQ